MTYDADGLRRSFALAGDETRFVWDNQDVLLETNAGGVTQTAYTQTPALFGEIVAQRKAGASHFYHFDGLGSTMELTDGAEATTDTLRYRAFGESLVATGTTAPRYRWVGKLGYYWQSDNGIALDYVRARWYRPRIGRWVSQDPLRQGTDQYVYATNDPARTQDPSGLTPTCDCAYIHRMHAWLDDIEKGKISVPVPARLDAMVQLTKALADCFEASGWPWAANAWRHWLDGTGEPYELPWDVIEGYWSVPGGGSNSDILRKLAKAPCDRMDRGSLTFDVNFQGIGHKADMALNPDATLVLGRFKVSLGYQTLKNDGRCPANQRLVQIDRRLDRGSARFDFNPGDKFQLPICYTRGVPYMDWLDDWFSNLTLGAHPRAQDFDVTLQPADMRVYYCVCCR